jgi:2-polyprenyl-3-methyl-5-hydroxy-6-metoxy-1,4-benzoquinol methylase
MAVTGPNLTAEDYGYRLPDHWLLNEDSATHFPIMYHAYVDKVVELVKQSGAQTVLEVGCGDGWICGKLVEAGLKVVGIDWSRKGIAYASILVPGGQFYCGDVRDTEFLSRFPDLFDALIFVEVLEHIPPDDCLDALRNITSVLKVGGTMILTTPSINFPNNNPHHYRHFDEQTLRNLVAEAGGLEITAIEGYGDVRYEARMYKRLRWCENRYLTIKPLRRAILFKYKDVCSRTPLDRCSGFILTIKKNA